MKTSIILPLPPGAIVTAKLGDFVTPQDVLWSFSTSKEDRTIHLARILKVTPEKISKFIKVKVGDELTEGQVIALKKNMLHKVAVKSPQSATLKEIDEIKGTVTLEVRGSAPKITQSSGISGKVIRISGEEIEIETEGHMYAGKKGEGGEVQGILHVVEVERITMFNLDDDFENAILLVNDLDVDVLTKLEVIGVMGLIILKKELTAASFPWLSVEKEVHEKLKKYHGKKVIIRPMQKMVVII